MKMTTLSAAQIKYLEKRKRTKRRIRIGRWSICLLFFLFWEVAARCGIIDSFIFSCPSKIAACLVSYAGDGSLFYHTSVTFLETVGSFFCVLFISLLFTVLLWCSKPLSATLEPYLIILNSLPKSALAPLLIVWLGTGYLTILVTGMSVAIFGSILTLYQGFMQCDEDKMRLIASFGGTKRDILFRVVLPYNLPLILSTMKVNIGLCLVGVIIGEFIASRSGLGYLIIYSSQIFRLDVVIMSILLLCVMAVCMYKILDLLTKKLSYS
jgi:NitT/TauT family transport system permease protein